jgi:Fe-S cluster assembly iron-binding protein IscA
VTDGADDGVIVRLTDAAAARVGELLAQAGATDGFLRVAIEKKGRPRHIVSLSDEPEDGDVLFEHRGISIALAQLQASMLRGATVDYVAGDDRFEVTNPNLVPLALESLPVERAQRRREGGGS